MTEPHAGIQQNGYKRHTHRHLLLTLILTINLKVAKFRTVKHKASINAINMSENPP